MFSRENSLLSLQLPSQFRRLAPALAKQGHDVVFLAKSREWHAPSQRGFD